MFLCLIILLYFYFIATSFQDYPEEELLIGYDPDFKYGQNFFIATTEEAKLKLLRVSI